MYERLTVATQDAALSSLSLVSLINRTTLLISLASSIADLNQVTTLKHFIYSTYVSEHKSGWVLS